MISIKQKSFNIQEQQILETKRDTIQRCMRRGGAMIMRRECGGREERMRKNWAEYET